MPVTTRTGMVLKCLEKLGIATVPTTRSEYIIMNGVVDSAVNIVLSQAEPQFSIAREKLVWHATNDNFSFTQEYSFPASMIKSLNLLSGIEYLIEGTYLYTTEEPSTEGPVLRFIKRSIQVSSGDTGWSGLPEFFYEAVAYKAAELAAPMLNKNDSIANMIQLYERAKLDIRVDNMENQSGSEPIIKRWSDGW